MAPGPALHEHGADLSADGTTLVTTWAQKDGSATRSALVAVDTATGERRFLVDEPAAEAYHPVISPDGTQVAFIHETITTPHDAPQVRLAIVALWPDGDTAQPAARLVTADWDRWPTGMAWLPDGSGLVVTADDDGRGPLFLLTLGAGEGGSSIERMTSDDAVFTDVCVAPDGASAYALKSSYLSPARPVRVDVAGFMASGEVGHRVPVAAAVLPAPVVGPALPGALHDVEARAADGTRVRGWLALPHGADAEHPAPLLLWIHGGPLASWNAWSWRWNPWLMVAQGYAVLLPDPALSTGYGQDFVQRGWGVWGAEPYTDLMAITDTVEAMPEIDETRTAAMGGSFGGYMANWVAGHTNRFKAIVTHASLWAFDQFAHTTDSAHYWQREISPEMAAVHSPHLYVGSIATPMLVVHGDKDYRVPIGEGLRLWYELLTNSALPADKDGRSPHQFLYFPDENHWVLSPQHAKIWYQVVSAFLAEKVLGVAPGEGAAVLPPTLG